MATTVPPTRVDLAALKRRHPLAAVVSATGVQLRPAGADRLSGCCPFHDDRTPSLHVYPTAERGWACFGCETPDGKPLGGDIYTLASRLWNIPARGASFFDLQARLDDVFTIHRDSPSRWPATRHLDNTDDLAPAIER